MDKRSMFYGAHGNIFNKARMLRGSETKAEKLLWMHLKENKLNGFRFKRQHPISTFIADFYCHKVKLVIEIDENYHNSVEQKISDTNRDAVMVDLGLKVLRFSDKEVIAQIDEVLDRIKKALLLLKSTFLLPSLPIAPKGATALVSYW